MFRSRFLPAVAVVGILVLVGCAPTPEPSTTPSSEVTQNDTPSSEPTHEPQSFVGNVPADCAAVGTAESRADSVDQLNLQGDGVGFVRPAPEGATLILGCDWFAGDTSGVLLLISEVDPAAAEASVSDTAAEPEGSGVSDALPPDMWRLLGLCTSDVGAAISASSGPICATSSAAGSVV